MLMTWLDFDFSRWASETSKFIYGEREHLNVNYSKRKKRQRGEHINNSFHYLAGSGKSSGEGRVEWLIRALLALRSALSAACWGSGLPPSWQPRALDSQCCLRCSADDLPGASDSQESACNGGDPGSLPGSGRFPWRREWQPSPVLLPDEFHGKRSLAGCSLWSHKESDTTEWLNNSSTWLEKFSKKP